MSLFNEALEDMADTIFTPLHPTYEERQAMINKNDEWW